MPDHLHSPFGTDRFGRSAERFARFFGTPKFIVGQTMLVAVWIALNAIAISLRWDPYPFILLNLAFSTQAAYAAPLILLAQTRQADRDKAAADDVARIADEQRHHVERRSCRPWCSSAWRCPFGSSRSTSAPCCSGWAT
jgi:uncharacterized membrane protein